MKGSHGEQMTQGLKVENNPQNLMQSKWKCSITGDSMVNACVYIKQRYTRYLMGLF